METRGPGRPPKEVKRDLNKNIRWTAEQWAELVAAAEFCGVTISAFVRTAALGQAREIEAKNKRKK